MGDVLLTAYHTPGHTRARRRGSRTSSVDGKTYMVVFPDGAGFNPGYRLAKNPSYPGHRRRLSPHAPHARDAEAGHLAGAAQRYYDLEGKRQRAQTEGVKAWIDPEGYRRFIAGKKREFEDQVDEELGASKGDAK